MWLDRKNDSKNEAKEEKAKLSERRNFERRKFGYYMRVVDNDTQQLAGYLADISPRGFKLDSSESLLVNKDYTFRLDLTIDISERPHIIFVARSKWAHSDATDPFSFNDGFQIVSISPGDNEIFQKIVTKYGTPESKW